MDSFTKSTHVEMTGHFKSEQLKRNSWKFGTGLVSMVLIGIIGLILRVILSTGNRTYNWIKVVIFLVALFSLGVIVWKFGSRKKARRVIDWSVFIIVILNTLEDCIHKSITEENASLILIDYLTNIVYFVGLSPLIDSLYLRVGLLGGILLSFLATLGRFLNSEERYLLISLVSGGLQALVAYTIFQSTMKQNERSIFNDFTQNFDKNVAWRKIIEQIPFSVAIIDLEGKLTYKNPTFDSLLLSRNPDSQVMDPSALIVGTDSNVLSTLSFITTPKFRRPLPLLNTRESTKEMRIRFKYSRSISWNAAASSASSPDPDLNKANYMSLKDVIITFIGNANFLMQEDFGWDSEKKEPRFEYVDAKYGDKSIEIALSFAIFNEKLSVLMLLTDTAMRDQIARIEDRDQYKSLLLSSVSHELRTPVNGTSLLLTEAIEDGSIPEDIKQKYIKPVLLNIRRLVYMVEGISDYSHLSFGKEIKLEKENLELLPFLNSLFEVVRFEAKKKDLALRLEIDEDIPSNIVTDGKRLGQLLMNLLQNAVKFTEKGRISLIVTHKLNGNEVEPFPRSSSNLGGKYGQRIYFTVKDTGFGMTIAEYSRLKKLLAQGLFEGKVSDQSAGACLGLKISNEIAKRLGSELLIKTQRFQGTSVSFFLPLPKPTIHEELEPETETAQALLISPKQEDTNHMIQEVDSEDEFTSRSRSKELEKRIVGKVPKIFYEPGSKPDFRITEEGKSDDKFDRFGPLSPVSLIRHVEFSEVGLINPSTDIFFGKDELSGETFGDGPEKIQSHMSSLHIPGVNTSNQRLVLFDSNREAFARYLKEESQFVCPDIFIVDDDLFNVDSIQRVLQKKGFVTDCAYNGREAIEKLKKLHIKHLMFCQEGCVGIQLILMDYNMPIMNGCEATRELKAMMSKGELHEIQIIGCTAHSGDNEIASCLESGMKSILIKPIKIDDVTSLIDGPKPARKNPRVNFQTATFKTKMETST